jgi:hypothetical protein
LEIGTPTSKKHCFGPELSLLLVIHVATEVQRLRIENSERPEFWEGSIDSVFSFSFPYPVCCQKLLGPLQLEFGERKGNHMSIKFILTAYIPGTWH